MPPPVVVAVGIGILVFMAVFVYALFRGSAGFEKERAGLFQALAERHGFTFDDTDRFGLRDKIRDFGAIGFANNKVVQVAHRRTDETVFYLFDQMKVSMSGAAQAGFYTICLAERQRPFGPEMIVNEVDNRMAAKMSRSMGAARAGLAAVETRDPAFDGRFVVFAAHPGQAATYLSPQVRRMLLAEAAKVKDNLVVQVRNNLLAVHNAGQQVRTIDTVDGLAVLYDIARQLDAAWR